jgi:hypothetical protein
MTVSGRASRPTVTLLDTVAVASGGTGVEPYANCEGFTYAYLEITCDKTHDYYLKGAGPAGGAKGNYHDGITALLETAKTGNANTPHGHLLDVRCLSWIGCFLSQSSGSDATVTITVTLSN